MFKLLGQIYPYIRPYWKKALGTIFFAVFLALLKGAQVKLVKPVFDNGLSKDGTFEEALILAGTLLFLGVLNFPARFLHFYWIRFVVDRATCDLREQIYRKLQTLPLKFYSETKQGTLISSILNDTITFSLGFRSSVDLIREPLTALVMLGMAIYTDWQLTLIIIVVMPLFLIIFQVSGKRVKKNQGEVQELISDMTHCVSEGVTGQKFSKAFNLQGYIFNRFKHSQEKYFGAQLKTAAVEEFAHPLVEFIGFLAFSGVIVFAHHRIASGELSTGGFVSYVAALALLMDPIRKFSQANVKLNQSKAAAIRIFELLGQADEVDNGNVELDKFNDKIIVKDLSFSYGDGDVLKNINLEINKGEKVALVGLSGSGKSTLISLLLRLYNIDRGSILIDGVEIDDVKLKSLRDRFALVSQDIFLFNDSIEENLVVGGNYGDEDLKKALEVSYSKEFIDKSSEGLSTIIGDRGAKLSGGQQQRVTIARAFLKNSDIFLFDEATSALDNESEQIVQKALDEISGEKTVLAVAHRLSTISNFDKIYVFKDGEIIEVGNHQKLMSLGGEYKKLYELSLQ